MAYTISSDIVIPDDATGILFYKDGQLVNDSLQLAYDFVVPSDECDHVIVVSGGFMEETLVNYGGVLTVLSGGNVETVYLDGGTMAVLEGGFAKDVQGRNNPRIYVAGGTVDGLRRFVEDEWDNNFQIWVTDNGEVRNVKTEHTEFYLSAGGKLSGVENIGGPNRVTIEAGGIFESCIVDYDMSVGVYNSGLATDLTLQTFLALQVYDGGVASRTRINGWGQMIVYGLATDTAITDGITTELTNLSVMSGGTALRTTIHSGSLHVSEGGLSLETRILGGVQTVLEGGVASRTEIDSVGSMVVSLGGVASETVLSRGGHLIVRHGGVAKDVQSIRNGAIQVERFGKVQDVQLDAYNMMVVSGKGLAEDVKVASGGVVYLLSGAVLGGKLGLENGAVVSAYEGAAIDFDLAKANAATALVDDLSAITGAPSYTLTVSADTAEGEYLLAEGAAGFTGTITVQDDTMCYGRVGVNDSLVYGWNTYTLNLNDEKLSLTVSRNAEEGPSDGEPLPANQIINYNISIQDGEVVTGADGQTFLQVDVTNKGTLLIQSGARVEETLVNYGGVLSVQDGGNAETIYLDGGTMAVLEGGFAEDLQCRNEPWIYVTGGTVDGLRPFVDNEWDNNYRIWITDNGEVRNVKAGYSEFYLSAGGKLSGVENIGGPNRVTIEAGGIFESCIVQGQMEVGVYNSGLAIDLTVEEFLGLQVYEGGFASRALIKNWGQMIVYGLAMDTVIEKSITNETSNLFVMSGGTAVRTAVHSGTMFVSEGGLSLEAAITGGTQTVLEGGVASKTEIGSVGSMVVSHGGLASETVLQDGGHLIVRHGGVAKDVHGVRDGAVHVERFGKVQDVQLDAYNMMVVSGKGLAEDVKVASGGVVYLKAGAVLGGHLQLANGANVTVFDGGMIDFDLSQSDSTSALIDNLSAITGAPSYTLTVSADTAEGEYLLAEGAAGFTGTITVQDDTMCYGRVGVNDSLVYGWNTYTLNLNDEKLSLTVSRNAEEGPSDGEPLPANQIINYNISIQDGEVVTGADGQTFLQVDVTNKGTLLIQSGARVEETLVNYGGVLSVQDGGNAETIYLDGGTMAVLEGGFAEDLQCRNEPWIYVTGGTVDGLRPFVDNEWDNNFQIWVTDNGEVRNVKAGYSEFHLSSGGKLSGVECTGYSNRVTIEAGGIFESCIVEYDMSVGVYNSGLATDLTLQTFLALQVYDGGVASRTRINGWGQMIVYGLATDTAITDGITTELTNLSVMSGGTALRTTIHSGSLHVSEGGLSLETRILGGTQTVLEGGVASKTEIGVLTTGTLAGEAGIGYLVLSNGGLASETLLQDGGHLIVRRGAVAKDVHGVRNGAIQVDSFGKAQDVQLDAYNMMVVSRKGLAEDVKVASGGVVYLLSGAVLGGKLGLENGAVVSAYEGAVVELDIARSDATTPLIDNLSAITGAPSYTLTVSADTAEGDYLLAEGAAGFTGTITVQDATTRYGTLTVANPLVCGWNTYTLNLNGQSLLLTVSRNETYHEPEEVEPEEPEEIIVSSGTEIASGETLVWEKTGDTVRITSGGILKDTEIPWGGTLILDEGAILQGTVRLGTDILVNGPVNAREADVELDISGRKEEYGTLLSDLACVEAASYTVLVAPDQNKGDYILAGNAPDFDGVITVKGTDGTDRGTISVEQEALDYGITRYTLTRNERDELVFIVSSNVSDETDYILLYKNNRLVLAKESESNLTISSESEFDQMIVLDKGVADRIELGDYGLVTVLAGGQLLVSKQDVYGKLNFDYTEGDSTVIRGINQLGAFFVENDVLENVYGAEVSVTGNVSIHNYYGLGTLTARDGVTISGKIHWGQFDLYDTTLKDVIYNAWDIYLHSGTITDSVFNGGWLRVRDGYVSNSVFNTRVSLIGGTYSDVSFNYGISINGSIEVESDLYFNHRVEYYHSSDTPAPVFVKMNGHTVTVDYTERGEDDDAMIALDFYSRDAVFQVNLNEDQMIGKYLIATWATRGLVDTYNICVDGSIIGTIDGDHPQCVSGNYVYTMTQEDDEYLFLTIDFSETADESYNVVWYDTDRNCYHSAVSTDLTIRSDQYSQAIVRNQGVLKGATLTSGGLLKVWKGGQVLGLDQQFVGYGQGEYGILRFDYTEGDSTVITGFNPFGSFFVGNNVLENVCGETVTVTGNVSIHNYYGTGTLTARNGVTLSGLSRWGRFELYDSTIKDLVYEAGELSFHAGAITDSVFNSGLIRIYDGNVSNTEFNSGLALYGGTFSDVTINDGFSLAGSIWLDGDLTLNKAGIFGYWDTCINANGHTITVNYSDRIETDGGMFSMSHISEDVNFRLKFRKDQKIGTYTLAWDVGSLVDFFLLNIDGVDTEELSIENMQMTYGIYLYTLGHDVETQELTMTIDISDDADETYNIVWYDTDRYFYHAETVNGLTVSTDQYSQAVVRNHGVLREATLTSGGLLAVQNGGRVIGLNQLFKGYGKGEYGDLRFDYTEGDSTVITGINPFGSFFVENDVLENVCGENITVSGNVSIHNYTGMDTLTTNKGVNLSGTFQWGNYVLSDTNIKDFVLESARDFDFYSGTIADSVFYSRPRIYGGTISDSVFNGGVTLYGGTVSEIVVNGSWYVGGYVSLDGDVTFRARGEMRSVISGNGFSVNLDLTERTERDNELLFNLNGLRNTELQITIDQRQPIGTYTLASNVSEIGQGDGKGVYDWDTNKWLFQGSTFGDLDNIIPVYDNNGIELANCTVNGDTEYYGRYNYTVFVDEDGYLKLKVGWNNRSDQVYSPDELEPNDTMETATVITESGAGIIPSLTIHSDTDVDWYQFELKSPGRKSSYIGIDFKQWAGDLDINLYNSKGELIDYARSVTDNEQLSLGGYTAGTYYMKVVGYNGNTNAYKLVYNLPEPIILTDEYELGNTPFSAVPLRTIEGKKTIHAAIQSPNDVDYFSFVLDRRGTTADSMTLSFDAELGDLDLYLFDVNGVFLLGKSISVDSGTETVSFAGLKRGIYVAKVVSKDGNTVANYELTFDVREDEVKPDRYENNDTMRDAAKLYTLNGEKTLDGLSIHQHEKLLGGVENDVDYYSFSILEKGSADDTITLNYVIDFGDLDLEILNVNGEVVAYSRTAENEDTVSLKGLDIGKYYIRVYGYNNVANNYSLSWHVTNSALIPSDPYEGNEPIPIREDQTITGLSIAKVREEDETREDTFKIELEYDAWKRSKIILTDYRSDWEDGMKYVIRDAEGNVVEGFEGTGSEISLYGLKKGEYYLTLDAPTEDEYSEYSLIAQHLPDSDVAKDNTWSIFIYMAGDNNLEGAYLQELLFMQKAILPDNVEVYVLMDRSDDYAVAERNWTDTRVGRIRHSKGGAVAVQWMYFNGADTDTYMNTRNLELRQEWDTGDVATLEGFLDWGMKVGRADNYALIMKDHGSSLGYNCSDESSGSIMSIQDVAELLKDEKYKDLSVVAFDQCLMGSDVVVTTMEGTVDYVVASEAVGYTPNRLVMYKVLLNSLETDMTPQEVSQKIVAACNCSGVLDLTLASFKSDDHTLSSALNQFGELAKQFSYADWGALCKCFRKANNYGDTICAFSDLGGILNMIKGCHGTISSTLLDAANALYDTVINTVIDSTMITPDAYGTGLAVFNPVRSDPMMSAYSYGGGSALNYYATDIGKDAWGEFMYTLSRLADDCDSYIIDSTGGLTFTSFNYCSDDNEIWTSYDLGAFSGNGVSFEGLYMDHAAYFNITLKQAGSEGDAIVVTADNPDAVISVSLVQTVIPSDEDLSRGAAPSTVVCSTAKNGVLSLAGIAFDKNRAMNDYTLIVKSTGETTFDLKFVADWTTGVDYFDYSRSGSIEPLSAGNNSIDKATSLPNGNYGGLVTCAGDKDYYKILSVYANTIDVTVKGTGLVVREYNFDGDLLQTAVEDHGEYKLTVAKDNYVCVEGSADIAANQCNSYSLCISDVAETYLKAQLDAVLPEKPVLTSELKDNRVTISVDVEDGLQAFYSNDMFSWLECGDTLVATENDRYYFKAVDTQAGVESLYTSLSVIGIDKELPVVGNLTASIPNEQVTHQDVVVTAEFTDNVSVYQSRYKIGEDGEWMDYPEDGVTVAENATVFFKAIDLAGNESEIVSYEVKNIDKVKPVITLSGDNQSPLQKTTLTATVDDGSELFYSNDGETWTKYEGAITVTSNETYYFKATDAAGNESIKSIAFENIIPAPFSDVTPQTQTWEQVGETIQYIVQYSTDNFEHVIQLVVDSNSLDSFQLPAGNYQMRVKPVDGEGWTVLEPVVAEEANDEPKLVRSNSDGNADVFFANVVGTWETGYLAQHVGSQNDWNGTNEYAAVYGKNKLADIFEGSIDANILLLTDDSCGDGLFVDDIYTESPDELGLIQSRLAQIDEICAGVGNDIVDMTSRQFEYIGDGLTIRGGEGNDTIWANKGDNFLFGDAGNDRIVGASGNDVIAGGSGNDRMHGGGGNDVFTFCDNWGTDEVEQLADGSVTLWFAAGDESKWNADTLTYTDGENSVTVSGVTAEQIALKFDDDGSARYAALTSAGAFLNATSERIFEESGKGMLASL